jgi:hypothetical protein
VRFRAPLHLLVQFANIKQFCMVPSGLYQKQVRPLKKVISFMASAISFMESPYSQCL